MAIGPGPLTTSGAKALTDFVRRTQANADALARRIRKPERFIPAQVTEYDAATNAYTWHERAIASDGTRYDKPNGRSGSPTYGPAYGIGDGGDALLTIPADVTLRMATTSATLGPVYEFPTVCACAPGVSGSSIGFCNACDGWLLPHTLDATFDIIAITGVSPTTSGVIETINTTLEYGAGVGCNCTTAILGHLIPGWSGTVTTTLCNDNVTIGYCLYVSGSCVLGSCFSASAAGTTFFSPGGTWVFGPGGTEPCGPPLDITGTHGTGFGTGIVGDCFAFTVTITEP